MNAPDVWTEDEKATMAEKRMHPASLVEWMGQRLLLAGWTPERIVDRGLNHEDACLFWARLLIGPEDSDPIPMTATHMDADQLADYMSRTGYLPPHMRPKERGSSKWDTTQGRGAAATFEEAMSKKRGVPGEDTPQ